MRLVLTHLLFSTSLLNAAWLHASPLSIGLPVWGNGPIGVALAVAGIVVLIAGFLRPTLAGWFPHPKSAGLVAACFGLSVMARSVVGLWLVSPAAVAGAVTLAVARCRTPYPWLAADDDTRPTFQERARFWFSCGLPWVVLYEFTSLMGLQGQGFGFDFEDRLGVYPATSLLYQSTYVAVAVAPFLAATRRQLRQLTLSAWASMALIFPFYWMVPSTGPTRVMEGHSIFTPLLAFERNYYLNSEAFPSFHVLWSVFIARLLRPRSVGWIYVLAVSVSCVTTGMHYVADVLAAFALMPLLLAPEQRLWRPLRAFAGYAGVKSESLPWALAVALLAVVLSSMWRQGAAANLMGGVALIGFALLLFARAARNGGSWWPAGAALAGAVLTIY